jgi:hypothetical protein
VLDLGQPDTWGLDEAIYKAALLYGWIHILLQYHATPSVHQLNRLDSYATMMTTTTTTPSLVPFLAGFARGVGGHPVRLPPLDHLLHPAYAG